MKKIKVIHIMGITPPYEEYTGKTRPEINWDIEGGKWVGIWGYDWADLIGMNILKYTDDILYEVWQCDYRADKIYTHEYENGLIHTIFPANKHTYFFGLKKNEYFYSDIIVEKLKLINEKFILTLPASYSPFFFELSELNQDYKILGLHLLNNNLILPAHLSMFPYKMIHRSVRNHLTAKQIKNYDSMVIVHNDYYDSIENLYNIKTYFVSPYFGFEYWKKDKSKQEARKILDINLNDTILLCSQRLVPEYQIDKLIVALSKFKNYNFVCYVTGHGKKDYEDYLKSIVTKQGMNGRVVFTGYISNEELKNYIIAADVFMAVPIMCGGSHGALKSMFLGTPVIHTNSGLTYEILRDNKAGMIIPANNCKQWESDFKIFFENKKIDIIDVNLIKDIFDEKLIAIKWNDIIKGLYVK